MAFTDKIVPTTQAKTRLRFGGALALFAALLAALAPLTGCVVLGASSRGGFFIWPGGFGLILLIVVVLLLLRRR